jgi:hypothetical protein
VQTIAHPPVLKSGFQEAAIRRLVVADSRISHAL